jgi:hypothetical protein
MSKCYFTKFALVSLSLGLCACATIIKNPKQTVVLNGGLEDGSTKVSTPEGNFTLNGGATTIMLTRTSNDIPIEVTCNGSTQKTVLPTHFDWGWAGLGNIVFGGIPGWIVDGVGDKGYDIQKSFNVGPLCSTKSKVNNVTLQEPQ